MFGLKKVAKDSSKMAGTLVGNRVSINAQNATNAAVNGMDLFRDKVASPIIQNRDFAYGKGNLFEYIEVAKFNVDAASKGVTARAVVTDIYDSGAAADILIKEGTRTQREVQAKFETSAASTVFDQAGGHKGHWGKYNGMDRLVRKDDNYMAGGSLLDEAKKLAKNRSESGSIHADDYWDVYEHLEDELKYESVTSGGTTIKEVKTAYDTPDKYARDFEKKVVKAEMKATATNMAKASLVTTGIVSGITNMFEVFRDKKELADALHDVGADAVKGGIRGSVTGAVSTVIRYEGIKAGSSLLSDATAATVMAGGIIDGGVALYSYAKGEITAERLKDQIVDTTAKAAATIYFTKAVTAIMGKAVNPFIPITVYTTASYVVACTSEIIRNANLHAEEYDRMTAILEASTKQMNDFHEQFKLQVSECEERQRLMFDRFINSFEYNLKSGENYDQAIYAIIQFADEAGIALLHVDFDDFSDAMRSKEAFVLK